MSHCIYRAGGRHDREPVSTGQNLSMSHKLNVSAQLNMSQKCYSEQSSGAAFYIVSSGVVKNAEGDI